MPSRRLRGPRLLSLIDNRWLLVLLVGDMDVQM